MLKRPQDVEAMRAAGKIVATAFAQLKEDIRPGVSLRELDERVAALLKREGAEPLYQGYRGNPPTHPPFPGVICASVNNQVCHGLPTERRLSEGDIVGIDIGLKYKGWCGDSCVTYPVGRVTPQAARLLEVAEAAMWQGIHAAQVGRHLSDIGAVIQAYAAGFGYSVIYNWGGHGIGRNLHEDPSVPHRGPGGQGPKLRPGMIFTVEPMINAGGPEWVLLRDGWTVVTKDGALSAQFEHTIVITPDGPGVLSKL
ncbi:MAG: type I methionyl aminopeptidase [Anaerolineales bacterium]|nr:type I methionyl aminopeptidase [Anaerolineales bacterium]